jgi:7,8-dihydropterin-6-yl-methyl-4-(beta-D-ribofuranosyl)aminobenzene 5'-phosphate synthase
MTSLPLLSMLHSPYFILPTLVLLLTGCGATPSPAAIPPPTALATVPSAITSPPLPTVRQDLPTAAFPSPTLTATPVLSTALSAVEGEAEGLTPTPQPTSLPTKEIMEPKTLTLTIVYDNNAYDPRLKTAWGFSCLIEYRGQVILFDTGGDSPTLLANMAALGIDPGEIEAVVLSHIHGDHTGGLSSLLPLAGDDLTVFIPQSFPARFKDAVRIRAYLVEVFEAREIGEEVYTTGEMGTGIIEQSLAVKTDEGLVVVTGCAHPGIVEIVRKAKALSDSDDEVYLVLGGFHLGGKSRREIEGIISEFRRLGVRKVAPCHCTGEQAIRMFRQEYGEDFIQAGAGKVIHILPLSEEIISRVSGGIKGKF